MIALKKSKSSGVREVKTYNIVLRSTKIIEAQNTSHLELGEIDRFYWFHALGTGKTQVLPVLCRFSTGVKPVIRPVIDREYRSHTSKTRLTGRLLQVPVSTFLFSKWKEKSSEKSFRME